MAITKQKKQDILATLTASLANATSVVFVKFGKLSVKDTSEMRKALKAEGSLSILLVEQFVDFCRDVADRFYAMDRGAVVISGAIGTLTDAVVKEHLQV